jgi:hypothetical protein
MRIKSVNYSNNQAIVKERNNSNSFYQTHLTGKKESSLSIRQSSNKQNPVNI